MEPRQTFTQNLGDIIETLQLARKTGLLTVERDLAGKGVEQGTISFYLGKITQVSAGNYQSLGAVTYLKTWRNCRFAFLPASSPNTPPPLSRDTGRLTHDYPPRNLQREQGTYPLDGHAAPYRVQQAKEALPKMAQMGFSRLHKQVFLLINGQRNLAELARLTGHNPDEIDMLLADLEHAHFIHR